MHAAALAPHRTAPSQALDVRSRFGLALACLCAAAALLAARWIPDAVARIGYGLLVAAVLLALTLLAGKVASLRQFRELSFPFAVFALVQVLNDSIPGYVGVHVLRDPPTSGNPLASTVSGSVVMQLLETAIAVVPILVLTKVSGLDMGSIYARRGVIGRWLLFAVGAFVAFYLFTATLPLRPGSPVQHLLPTNGAVTLDRFLALTPALLVMVLSNGFQEELLFRGLFLQRYTRFFGAGPANILQAAIFAFAHAGVTYTPTVLLFIVAVVFPGGLLAGYLMRASDGVVAPAIFHAAADIPIYLGFLSWVALT
jgi:membrane protease YdiL (CAAX protease family)